MVTVLPSFNRIVLLPGAPPRHTPNLDFWNEDLVVMISGSEKYCVPTQIETPARTLAPRDGLGPIEARGGLLVRAPKKRISGLSYVLFAEACRREK